jgi:hypothetical protein
MFGFKQIGVLKHPGYNGKGGGGSSSSTPTDFFGKGVRKPYADLLSQLLLGGNIGATDATTTGRGKNKIAVPGKPGVSLQDFITQQPGYQFGLNTGLEALQRQYSSTGMGPSGGENVALQGYGQQYAGNYYQQMIQNLMGPSGSSMAGQTSQSTGPTSASPLYGIAGMFAGSQTGSGLIGSALSSIFG